MWRLLLYQPLVNALILLYLVFGHNFGLAIIVLTILIRLVLMPITQKSLESAEKIKKLQPELSKLKKKYSDDKQAFAQAQMELYKTHKINPAAGCLPQIVQMVVLIALFQAFNQVLRTNGDVVENLQAILYGPLKDRLTQPFNLRFLYLDLGQPDIFKLAKVIDLGIVKISKLPGLFLVAAAITQFLSSKLMLPTQKKLALEAKVTPGQEDDMAVAMQTQMVYLFPLMTLFVGFNFPSGLVLYWLTFSLLMLITQLRLKKNQANKK
ncbi:YidC/Oxa1 family membrane protein insertase [Patescibacteria group bacterium]|nr:YidC/Oxa1 family membrane protein insertase [Patescibacteria group bacterium]MBU1931876.1 YidC/Oxa1 family membrane protein insertase [Patescibacteria group bacterium]